MGSTDRMRYLPIGLAASVAHALLMIPGYHEDDSFQTKEWIVMLVISLVVATLLFTLVVPGGGARTAVVLGVLACLVSIFFWMMLGLPFAVATLVTGMRARKADPGARMATVAVVLGTLAALATLVFTIGDWMSNN
jgi:multisubunit Na+/H+ antiporter MnhE subunit